jgi:hypothetical protein
MQEGQREEGQAQKGTAKKGTVEKGTAKKYCQRSAWGRGEPREDSRDEFTCQKLARMRMSDVGSERAS